MDQPGRFCFTLYCCYGYWQRRLKVERLQGCYKCRRPLHCKPSLCCYRYSDVLYRDSEKDKFSESVFAYGKKNIILIGGPNINAATKMYFDENIEFHPILFDEFGFLLGNCKFHRPGYGLIALLPFRSKAKNKSHSLVLLIAGTDSNGLRSALRLAEPTYSNDAITIL